MRIALLLLLAVPACIPVEPDYTCDEHLWRCLESPLGDVEDDYGHSVCVSCFDICKRNGGDWPDRTWSGYDCRWWGYTLRAITSAEADGGICEAHDAQ